MMWQFPGVGDYFTPLAFPDTIAGLPHNCSDVRGMDQLGGLLPLRCVVPLKLMQTNSIVQEIYENVRFLGQGHTPMR